MFSQAKTATRIRWFKDSESQFCYPLYFCIIPSYLPQPLHNFFHGWSVFAGRSDTLDARSKILFSISSFTFSVNIGSSMFLTLPLWYLLKACINDRLNLRHLKSRTYTTTGMKKYKHGKEVGKNLTQRNNK